MALSVVGADGRRLDRNHRYHHAHRAYERPPKEGTRHGANLRHWMGWPEASGVPEQPEQPEHLLPAAASVQCQPPAAPVHGHGFQSQRRLLRRPTVWRSASSQHLRSPAKQRYTCRWWRQLRPSSWPSPGKVIT